MTRLLAAELLKLTSTRVTYVLLGLALLVSGLTAVAVASADALDEEDPALAVAEAVSFSTFLALVVGILLTTNEYRHGTITSTFLVTPSRPRVLTAKLLAGGVAGGAFAAGVALVAFGIAVPWLSGDQDEIPLDGQFLEAVGRLLALYTLFTLAGVAVGAIVQNQVGAIVATVAWLFVIEEIVALLTALAAGDVGDESPIGPYLPGAALTAVTGGADADALEAGWAVLLSAAYVAALAALGAVSMVRRDPA
jgi:ABC-2 type transport system permease protein